MSPDLLLRLAEAGNSAVILKWLASQTLSQSGYETDLPSQIDVICERSRRDSVSHSVFAPVATEKCKISRGISLRLEVKPGENDCEVFDPESLEAISMARRDAWRVCGCGGEPSSAGISVNLSLSDGFRVKGSSIYLPALITFTGFYSRQLPIGNIMATGSFDRVIDHLDIKLSVLRDAGSQLHPVDGLLMASSSRNDPLEGIVQCSDAEDALVKAFGYVPWQSGTEGITRLHVFCDRPRSRYDLSPFEDQGCIEKHKLPFPLEPGESFEAAVMGVVDRINQCRNVRVDLTLAGPMPLASRLGYELRNSPKVINLVHAMDHMTWWNNRIGTASADGGGLSVDRAPAQEETARLVLGRNDTVIPPGWELLADRSQNITRESARDLISRLVERIRSAERIDVAVAGPIPLAWAVGHTLRNAGKPVRFHEHVGNSYKPFWEANGRY